MKTKNILSLGSILDVENFIALESLQKSLNYDMDGFRIVLQDGKPAGVYMSFSDRKSLVSDVQGESYTTSEAKSVLEEAVSKKANRVVVSDKFMKSGKKQTKSNLLVLDDMM